jgi:hypothetical protein
MRVTRWLLMAALFAGCVGTTYRAAEATLLNYEGVDYDITPGDEALLGKNGGTGWNGGWYTTSGSAQFTVSQDDVSLDSPAFPFTPTGNRILAGGDSDSVSRIYRNLSTPLNLENGDILYISFLWQKNGADAGTASNNLEFGLVGGGTVTDGAGIRLAFSSGNAMFLGTSANTFGPAPADALDTTYFMVLRVEGTGVNTLTASAMVFSPTDSVSASEPITWDATIASYTPTGTNNNILTRIRLWAGENATGQFDEIRVGSTWVSVVPEPSTVLLMCVGIVAVGTCRLRRRK